MKIDKILTGKYTAIPCFIGIMGLVFFLTFSVIGAFLQNILDMGITALGNIVDHWMMAAGVNDVLHSLVMDGVFNGVGSVLSFLPVIVTLFFFLSLLEDSGYMARVAFVMDKLLRKIGLSGRTVRPKLIITCGVSGAIQFTSCMTGSDCIVAINNDPEAQIFNVADYCIVDDLYQVVPELTELIKNRKED